MKSLHILNGDSSLELFKKINLPGDTMVWREMLSEGRSGYSVGSSEFWKARKSFFAEEINVTSEEYETGVISEFKKIESPDLFDEIILWFEYDLFCQINLMAILSYLKGKSNNSTISLICVGKFPDSERLLGLGQLSIDTFGGLFDKRSIVQKADMNFADEIWKIYNTGDHSKLSDVIKNCPDLFEYLPAAIDGHLKRFPRSQNGLTGIENKILQLISETPDGMPLKHVIRALLISDQVYGLGDMVYMNYVKKLSMLYDVDNENLRLNNLGIEIKHGKQSLKELRKDYYFGGASIKVVQPN